MYKQSPNQYITDIVNAKLHKPLALRDPRIQPLINVIDEWAGRDLATIKVSGSSAKGTALIGSADLDLFISLKESTSGTLKGIYDSLYDHIGQYKNKLKLFHRKQNVSIRVYYKDFKIDMVPGKKMPGVHNRHSIYVRRDPKDRTQTNIDEHIALIKNSGRIKEIVALKIWRDLNKLDFPSIYLELLTLDALRGMSTGKTFLERNFMHSLDYIAKKIKYGQIVDPVNTSNIISHTLNQTEKNAIKRIAERDLTKPSIQNIIW